MAEPDPTPSTNESRDGTGAADHDQPYQFGHTVTTDQPHPFSHAEFAHLLIVRGRRSGSERAYRCPHAR
jgi:hypothetical protein